MKLFGGRCAEGMKKIGNKRDEVHMKKLGIHLAKPEKKQKENYKLK